MLLSSVRRFIRNHYSYFTREFIALKAKQGEDI